MSHPYAGETAPLPVHDLARPAQQGWLSFSKDSQYSLMRQQQAKRRPFDRPRRSRRAAQAG